MGFFDRIFGKTKSERKTRVLELEKLDSYVEEKAGLKAKELEKTVFSKLSEVKYLLGEIKTHLGKLKEKEVSLEQGNLRLRKVVKTSQKNLFLQLNTLVNKLEPPKTSDLNKIMDYTIASSQRLSKEIIASRKNIAYAKTILEDEIKDLGKLLNELDSTLNDLKNVFNESSLKEIQDVKKRIQGFNLHFDEKKALLNSLSEKRAELKNFESKKEKIVAQLDELQNSHEMSELKSWESKKTELLQKKRLLRNRFVLLLGEVEKPLHRFLQLVDSKKYIVPEEERELLNLYLQNIFFAVKKDPKATVLKKLLIEVEKLVLDSTIALKEREKEKKLSALRDLIEFDFFSELFWKLNSIDSEINSLDKKIKNSSLSKKISYLEQEINSMEHEISEKNDFIKKFSSKISGKKDQILSLKESIERDLNQSFEENIIIKIPGGDVV